jgi:hypothetical protein
MQPVTIDAFFSRRACLRTFANNSHFRRTSETKHVAAEVVEQVGHIPPHFMSGKANPQQ